MDLQHLRTFFEVAKAGNLSKAAERLYITQPALSRQMDILEKSVGIALFTRHSRGMKLTEAGRRLYEYAEKALRMMDEAERVLKEMQELEIGRVAIAASTTMGNYVLPKFLAGFARAHSGIDVSLQVANSERVIDWVLQGSHDVGFVAKYPDQPGLSVEPILEDEIVILAAPKPIHEEPEGEVAKGIFLLREIGSATREIAESILYREGIKPSKVVTLGNTEAIKRAVMAGMGVTFLSKFTVELELENKVLVTSNNPKLKASRQFFAIYPKGSRLSPAVLGFLSHIKKENTKRSHAQFEKRR